jgi:hypothetical protein
MAADLTHRHRDTLERIFSHPSSGNIEWRQVLSLLETIGTTTQEHNGKVKVTLGPETEILQPPRGKDIDQQTIVDLRRMLTQAGFAPAWQQDLGHGDGAVAAAGDGQDGSQREHIARSRPDHAAQRERLRRLRGHRRMVVSPAPVRPVRAYRLLRQLTVAARQRARGSHRAPGGP